MSSSKINEAVKEAVIAEVKKLTGYSHESTFSHRYNDGDFSVKYQAERYIDIYNGKGISISFKPDLPAYDLIWQKAAEMLEICGVVSKTESDPKRQKVFNTILGIALLHLNWWLQSLDDKVTDDESIGYVKFWGGVKNTYGENIPSNETSNLIDAKVKKGCTRREYLELIVDEIMAQSADKPTKKETPEYVPPTPPVNPIEVALAEIDKLKIRVAELESVKDVEIEALRKYHAETELDAKTLANLAYNRVSAFIGQGITPSQSDFETWWTEFRKENGFEHEPQKPDYTPSREQCEALWLLVKDGDKSFPNALPYKFSPHMFQPNVLHVVVQDTFEFTISPNKFYPFVNSKGERPTFDQCRQAIAGTLASTLETLFNDGKK